MDPLFSISRFHALSWFGLLSGTLLALSSNSWFGVWCGLEINIISFISFIIQTQQNPTAETVLKYFLVQATSSFILLASVMFHHEMQTLTYISSTLALTLKLGTAPFHFWFPQISEGLGWTPLLVLMTIQKLAPLTLLSYILSPHNTFTTLGVIMLSGLVGALGGLNELSIRKLLSFSSINHIGWMLLAMLISKKNWLLYFLIYSVILMSLTPVLHNSQTNHISHLLPNKLSPQTQMTILFGFLSLGGLPPLLGFLPKWMVIYKSMSLSIYPLTIMLTLSSTITLFYYLRLNTNSMLLKLPTWFNTSQSLPVGLNLLSTSTNTLGTIVVAFLWSTELLQ